MSFAGQKAHKIQNLASFHLRLTLHIRILN